MSPQRVVRRIVFVLLGLLLTLISETVSLPANQVSAAFSASTTTLTSSVNPSAVGQTVTFTAKVTGFSVIQGDVTFIIDGTFLPNAVPTTLSGVATIDISTLAAGSHTIKASYGGDGLINAPSISAPLTQVVTVGGPPPPTGLQFYPLSAPVRLLDTRPGQSAVVHPGVPLTPNQALTLPGQFSSGGVTVPAGAQALVGNATVDNTVGAPAGFATLYPSGASLPLASNLNFVPGTVRPNAFTVGLGQ